MTTGKAWRWGWLVGASMVAAGCGDGCRATPGPGVTGSTVSAPVASSASVPPDASAAAARARSVPPWPAAATALSRREADALALPGEVRLELVGAGTEPRRLLRYAPRVPSEAHLRLTVDVGVTISFGVNSAPSVPAVPRLDVDLDTELDDPEPSDDRFRLKLRVRGAVAVAASDGEREAARALAPVVTRLVGVQSYLVLTDRGLTVSGPELGPGSPAELVQLWTSIAEALRDAVPPLPESEVGIGGAWRVLDRVQRAGVGMLRLTEHEVAGGGAAEVAIEARIREIAIVGVATDPSLAPEARIEVVSGTSRGHRTVAGPLGAVVASRSSSRIDSQLVLATAPPPGVAAGPDGKAVSTLTLAQVLLLTREKRDAGKP